MFQGTVERIMKEKYAENSGADREKNGRDVTDANDSCSK